MAVGNGYAVGVEVEGVRYPSARSADDALGFAYGTVRHRAHSAHYPTYRWLGETLGPRQVKTFEERMVGRPLTEPDHWPYDGGARRVPVMDPNFDPPRLVRRVGWLRCMRCGRPHFSEDVTRIRLCCACGGSGGLPIGVTLDEDP